ncbi:MULTISPECIES: ABC transporter ATP-binding protein [unclassified Oceanispirochaeta]|uniref:ABC transporter ATP-binding protein n=1 Tax=unclassified Oceanispirochaeta TaxID=2635722 RepID=UPI000E093752|nr:MULTISPECIES: oligopeptide/dipeptide ABC transporter ATP-binding protein [unclassified Oceanispirochaeta]MBF9018252.1 ATP-binding cassette domain-containing protein [Oceanispirochaeta sp. M2]NPD74709.1 ATP-binding cassette domain-containing protein [Oceanispirochaeta sp. M1]RDG29435.1 ATP-binding cassette domain-containing protein [Oceanispirochaeta sp. M1]
MSDIILKVHKLNKVFFSKGTELKAVNDLSFEVKKGETIGIVGESGCGKSTLGRCIVNSIAATSGSILYNSSENIEYDIAKIDKKSLKKVRKEIQLIFQDPYSSLNPRMSVFDIISEPLKVNYKLPKREVETRVKAIAKKVGLNPSYLKRYPHAFSGGQRQRIGIARALIFEPELIVCDEAVSALDVSVQAQVVNLLKDLQNELGLTYLFISHDLSVVEYIADKIGVMYLGKLVEYAATDEMFKNPLHPYTEALLSAVPIADPNIESLHIPLEGEIPNPVNPPGGCFFHTRCKYCVEKCKTESVELIEIEKGRSVACHRVKELNLQGII